MAAWQCGNLGSRVPLHLAASQYFRRDQPLQDPGGGMAEAGSGGPGSNG